MGSGHLHWGAHDRSLGILRVTGIVDPAAPGFPVGQGYTLEGAGGGPFTLTLEPQINSKIFGVLASGGAVSDVDQQARTFVLTPDGADPVVFEILVWTTGAMGSGFPDEAA